MRRKTCLICGEKARLFSKAGETKPNRCSKCLPLTKLEEWSVLMERTDLLINNSKAAANEAYRNNMPGDHWEMSAHVKELEKRRLVLMKNKP